MERRIKLGSTPFAAALAVVWMGCAGAPEPPPPPPSPVLGDIARRHYDQPCQEEFEISSFVAIDEIFDTLGLGREVEDAGPWPAQAGVVHPALDFITRYGADGAVTASGAWEATVELEAVPPLTAILGRRVRPLERLLEREGFHTRLLLSPTPRLELRPTIVCQPHLVHEEGEPPTGLPDGVNAYIGASYRLGSTSMVALDLTIAADGEVTQVTRRGDGGEPLMPAAREIVDALIFDPAARNGESVEGRVRLGLVFTR